MFYDNTRGERTMLMQNVLIDITGGTVYRSSHLQETYIDIINVSIQTNQLNSDDTKGLFNFELDDTVYTESITILFTYDASLHCKYNGTIYSSMINATSTLIYAKSNNIYK